MIRQLDRLFILETEATSYLFEISETGHLVHLYYGSYLRIEEPSDADLLRERRAFPPGNAISYDGDHPALSLEDTCLELSGYGKGDIREPFVEVVFADGSRTTDFVFESACVTDALPPAMTLPTAYDAGSEASHLVVTLKEKVKDLTLELHYSVFPECDVITRRSVLINTGGEMVRIDRLMSMQLDMARPLRKVTAFTGAWAREMEKKELALSAGKLVLSSLTGTSSNRTNPFFMVSSDKADEKAGEVLGFNLIYSGNHYESLEVSAFDKLRIVSGINPASLEWRLFPGESFEAPEAVLSYSAEGFGRLSRSLADFTRDHVTRGKWQKAERPILLNSWEAMYFDMNERKLLSLAKAAKEVGVELFVMDDGWFGKRNDDTSSLGDWTVNEKKLPGGLKGLSDKLHDMGLLFGIWVEPEMVNADSDLYRAHPDWTMDIPGRDHAEGRTQRVLDLANSEVVTYMTEEMKRVFSSARIDYVKWDMNRIFSDVYSKVLPPDGQGETAHRYVLGLYRMMKDLTEAFPDILFEGCASGGNRFDLGILSYFPQIWASDNTDALCRLEIEGGLSYGYPMSACAAHVSACPNHQTLRVTPLTSRFAAASFGVLGYECNLLDLSKEDLDEIREEIALYKKYRKVLQYGDLYRGREGNITEWTCVSKDKKTAVGLVFQKLVRANTQAETYTPSGLDPEARYRLTNRPLKHNIMDFGDLINTQTPVHIKQNSALHRVISRYVKMPGETEDVRAYGSAFMKAGFKLSQGFSGTGYSDEVRHFPDFASRLYFLKKEEDQS